MSFKVTVDQEEIKEWIEAHGGEPAIARDTRNENSVGTLEIKFKSSGPGLEKITWEEFFDIFESMNLALRYPTGATEQELGLEYSFIDRDKTPAQSDDETQLPEENEMARENMYSSASNNVNNVDES